VVDSLDFSPISTSATSTSSFPVTNLSIGASTAPETTLSFNADDVRLRSVDSPEPDPDGLENVGRYFNAEDIAPSGPGPVQTDSSFLNVSLSYEGSDVSGINESTIELLRFDNGPNEWLPTGSSVDTTNDLISVNITTFSDFGAFGEAEEATNFEISDLRAPAEVETGENLKVNATVENTGKESGEQNVTFRINETRGPLNEASVVVTKQNVKLSPGQNQTVEFEVNAPNEGGEYDHGIFTENDSETAVLIINETTKVSPPPGFPNFPGAANIFDKIDTNDDGNISPSEISIAVGEFLANGTVGGDRVSPAEMSQIVGWFLAQ
jgi:hypothetical protein